MLKILHIAPENYTGILMDFVKAHRTMGNASRLVTFFRCVNNYEEDICLDLPFVGRKRHVTFFKKIFSSPEIPPTDGLTFPHRRLPGNILENIFFMLRDAYWEPKVRKAFTTYGLWDYDIYHLEGGIEFLRNCKIVKELKSQGKKIVCNYHGLDLRVRGVIPEIDALSDLNLTCEFDLLTLHPHIRYFFLPFDTSRYQPRTQENERLRICHAPRNRAYKGTTDIIPIVKSLEQKYRVELVLIENKTHAAAMQLKKTCDIAIDQMVDDAHLQGGTGYGVNSLETLSLGIPTCTNLTPAYEAFIPDHPFIKICQTDLREKLIKLITNHDYRRQKGREGRQWVIRYHDSLNVIKQLYAIYHELHWITLDGQPVRS